MGKNQRHKKVLRSEKAKTKLKSKSNVTKFLPKGTNITNVNFKVKPIVIREQLKVNDKTDEPLTIRKLNYKDLLGRLNHHNLSSRCEACSGLSELVNSSPSDFVEQHLAELLHGVCKLTLDIEGKVREKAISLLSDIMKNVSRPEKLSPFYDILISYATCAMTHIKRNVQEDALLIVDTFTKFAPLLIYKHFDKLLDGFLSLISKLQTDSKLSRTLTDNLSSKLTGIKWRVKVLKRLQSILQTYIDKNGKFIGKKVTKSLVLHASQIGHYIPIYRGIESYPINLLGNNETKDSNIDKLQYVGILIPLLYETWAEVSSKDVKNVDNGFTILQQEAASLLSRITSVYYLLWKLVKLQHDSVDKDIVKVFLSKDHQKFLNHLLNQFPFRQNDSQKQRQPKDMKHLQINEDPKCVHENLLIVFMFCSLHRTFATQFSVTKAREIIDYLETCLVNRNYVPIKSIETLSMVLQVILFINYKNWIQRDIPLLTLLDNITYFYGRLPAESREKAVIFNLLCDVVELEELRSQAYEKWLCSLPSLLCKPKISAHVVDTLSVLTRGIDTMFLRSFKEKLPDILDNLTTIEILDQIDDGYLYRLKIISMFRYLSLTGEDKKLLFDFANKHKGSRLARYAIGIVQN